MTMPSGTGWIWAHLALNHPLAACVVCLCGIGVMHSMSHFYNAMADQRGMAKEDEDRHRTYRPFPSDYRDTVNAVAGGDWAHE